MRNSPLKIVLAIFPLLLLTACKTTIRNDSSEIYNPQKRDLRDECLQALKWEQQRSLDDLVDKDNSEGDRAVSAIIYANTNDSFDQLECETRASGKSKLFAVPEKPKPKKS